MLNTPKNFKYTKQQKGKLRNIVLNNGFLKTKTKFGNISLISLEAGRIFPNQITNSKLILTKKLKKCAKIRVNVFPQKPITKKPLEIRMGKGKGSVDTWAVNVFSGMILLEIESLNKELVSKCLLQVQNKLGVKTKIVYE